MRYIQMIKRCKIPLKKAYSDMESQGEEHAKRCKFPTLDVKPTVTSVEDRLGHLKDSAVARLLVEGKLPAETLSSPKPPLMNDTAMDLSKTSPLGSINSYHHESGIVGCENAEVIEATAERLRNQMGVEMEALKKRGSSNEIRFAGWKCRYCPYTAHSAKKLYSHYQFHQQLLTSQSSKAHLEWLTAYRHSREYTEEYHRTSVASPLSREGSYNGSPPGYNLLNGYTRLKSDAESIKNLRSSGLSLRYLLSGGSNGSENEANSASGCLRSIVQEVMKKDSPVSSQAKSQKLDEAVVNSPYSPRENYPKIEPKTEIAADIYAFHEEKTEFSNTSPLSASRVIQNSSPRKQMYIESVDSSISIPQRPLSRESISSYSSTASEEINVTDVPTIKIDRSRYDSITSDSSERSLVRKMSRKRSHSIESEISSLSSPSDQSPITSNYSSFQNIPHKTKKYLENKFNGVKSPRLDLNIEAMDTRPQTSSPVAMSSTGSPYPMAINAFSTQTDIPTTVEDLNPYIKPEMSVQCELLVPPPSAYWPSSDTFYQGSISPGGDPRQSSQSVRGCMMCTHCGISFSDSVLHSIHMGCHSHTDPFICNVCGTECHNKYGFYTHIMRGHNAP